MKSIKSWKFTSLYVISINILLSTFKNVHAYKRSNSKKLQDKGVNFLKEVKCDDWTIKNGDSIKN